MNKLRGVRPYLLLGLLLGLGSPVAAAAASPAPAMQGLNAAPILKARQWCVLDMARDRAAGTDLVATYQAIVLQESSAGEQLVNPRDPSYGAAGLEVATAQEISGRTVTKGQLVADTWQSITLGWIRLVQCKSRFGAWRRSVACYNHGPAGAAGMTDAQLAADGYVLAITRRLNQVRRIRRHADACPRD